MDPKAKIIVEVIYENIQEVVNLKCEECHGKLRELLKCLKQIHSKNHIPGISLKIPEKTEKVKESVPQITEKSQIEEASLPKVFPSNNSAKDTQDRVNNPECKEIEIDEVKIEAVNEPESSSESDPIEFENHYQSSDLIGRRKLILSSLTKFFEQEYQLTLESSLKSKRKFEEYLIAYLKQYRTSKNEPPKWKTLENLKSNLRGIILVKSRNNYDISRVDQFPRFNASYKEHVTKLKEVPNNITTRIPIPETDVVKIYDFLTYLHRIMNGTCTDLSRIPEGYHDRLHYIARSGVVFILLNYLPKRSPDKWCELCIEDFIILEHPDFGQCYQELNDPDHFIPFHINKYGLSPGQYLKDYIKKLKPFSKWLLTKPRNLKKSQFQSNTVWYEDNKIGIHKFGGEVPELTTFLGLPKYTPAQVTQIKMKTDNQEEANDPLADPPNKKIKVEVDDKDGSHFVFLKS